MMLWRRKGEKKMTQRALLSSSTYVLKEHETNYLCDFAAFSYRILINVNKLNFFIKPFTGTSVSIAQSSILNFTIIYCSTNIRRIRLIPASSTDHPFEPENSLPMSINSLIFSFPN